MKVCISYDFLLIFRLTQCSQTSADLRRKMDELKEELVKERAESYRLKQKLEVCRKQVIKICRSEINE
jgi:cell division protein FtsB